jgi:hypothetical protein
MDEEKRLEIANFRYGLIAPVVCRRLEKGEQARLLAEIALPGNTMTRMGKPSGLVYVPWNVIWQPTVNRVWKALNQRFGKTKVRPGLYLTNFWPRPWS